MPTIDEEVTEKALAFIDKAVEEDEPFFVWWNTTRMHIRTHLEEASRGVTGLGTYPDGMVEQTPLMAPVLADLDRRGSPWRFGTSEPEALLERFG